jgi:hypothetical protein
MSDRISDEIFDQIMNVSWEQIACFAYDGYRAEGRGAVGIEKVYSGADPEDLQFTLCFIVYDYDRQNPDPDAAKMIANYDPNYELVVQYLREDGSVRTARIRPAPGQRHPKRISLFEALMREDLQDPPTNR